MRALFVFFVDRMCLCVVLHYVATSSTSYSECVIGSLLFAVLVMIADVYSILMGVGLCKQSGQLIKRVNKCSVVVACS